MSVLEPVAAPAPRDTVAVEELPEVIDRAVETPPAYDHVRSHSMKCYWDFRECRWECSDS